jgi:hypothetical protein
VPARPLLWLVACLALALPVGACGGGGGSDEDDVKDAVNGVYGALADEDEEQVCDSLSKQGKEQVTESGGRAGKRVTCESILRLGFVVTGDTFKDARDAKVTDVQVDGDQATATVEYKRKTGDVSLVKEDGEWKLDDLDTAGS